jgi:hypothetical protein
MRCNVNVVARFSRQRHVSAAFVLFLVNLMLTSTTPVAAALLSTRRTNSALVLFLVNLVLTPAAALISTGRTTTDKAGKHFQYLSKFCFKESNPPPQPLASRNPEQGLVLVHAYSNQVRQALRVCRVSCVVHVVCHLSRVSCVVCRVSCVVCRVSCVVCRVSCVVCRVSCVVCRTCRVSCVVCRVLCVVYYTCAHLLNRAPFIHFFYQRTPPHSPLLLYMHVAFFF